MTSKDEIAENSGSYQILLHYLNSDKNFAVIKYGLTGMVLYILFSMILNRQNVIFTNLAKFYDLNYASVFLATTFTAYLFVYKVV